MPAAGRWEQKVIQAVIKTFNGGRQMGEGRWHYWEGTTSLVKQILIDWLLSNMKINKSKVYWIMERDW